MIKVLITDKLAQEGIDLLNSKDGVQAEVNTGLDEDQLAEIIKDYDGLIIRSGTKVTKKVLLNQGNLKAIARAGVGVDNIDIPEATRKGIIVMNTPGGNTQSAAEHTVALMIAMSRNIVPACNSLKSGAWDRKKYMGNQLNSKVLGVIGLGRIGMAVAKIAAGFNMKIIGYDPIAATPDAEKIGVEITGDVNEIYKKADYITVHVPKNDDTTDMISREQIKMMKKSVRLINCARGGIINEDAAYDALEKNEISGVAFDVFPSEPPKNDKFKKLDNCLVTPHLGASTEEAQIAPSTPGAVPPIITRYSSLSRRIGMLLSVIAPGKIKSLQAGYRGDIAEMDVNVVSLNFIIGMLQKHFDIPLNIVNVLVLAKERGISLDETKNAESKDVSSAFSAKVVTDKVTRTVTGSIFGGTLPRIIEIDGFNVEITPEETVLVIYNDDKPGVIGAVGSVCGKYSINICTMGVGEKPEEQKAILAVSVDKDPEQKVIDELKKLNFINELYVCKLD